MLSYWERDALCAQDVIIIGGGLLGLSTALSVKEKAPRARILVLERGVFPTGASTRNAGMACFAKACELLEDIKVQGEKEAAKLVAQRAEGLKLLRSRISDSAMEFLNFGGHELIRENDKEVSAADLKYLNELLHPYFEQDVFSFKEEKIAQFGFQGVKQLIYNPLEGQLHSGKLISAMWRLINALGVRIISGAEVKAIEAGKNQVEVFVHHQHLGEDIRFTAGQVGVCTNALSKSLLKEDIGIQPGRGQVLITKPMRGLNIEGSFHFDEGYYYFRNHEDRLLLGGGRNLDKAGETTEDMGLNDTIQAELERLLKTVILPGVNVEIDQRWSGIMGFSENKMPIVKRIEDRRSVGLTCNGMGVALSTLTGEKLAELLAVK
ncbi:MAG: FAD-binding oxidoreductase [Bacteroidota bacterium]|nr:FAD-binding oxidoreductase [Bacteroidota bacterium]MDX5431053.1 FAD-binding oxidoreductase [Bacteroidota bacterium]MDX5469807.1 FAD-binding oxidoreductase [Bacteroidota bacterium]